MSFSIEFNAASKEDALTLLNGAHAPECVKAFLVSALNAVVKGPVYVKAIGHLFDGENSYRVSNADIQVREIAISVPTPVPTPHPAGVAQLAEQTPCKG